MIIILVGDVWFDYPAWGKPIQNLEHSDKGLIVVLECRV